MADHEALRAAWLSTGGTLKQRLQRLNAMMVTSPRPGPVAVADLRARLPTGHLELFALGAATESLREHLSMPPVSKAVRSASLLIELLSETDTLHPHQLGVVRSLLSDLASDPLSGVGQADVDAVLALSTPPVSWPAAHGFGERVQATDLIAAGLS
jgi:hypothetical protein